MSQRTPLPRRVSMVVCPGAQALDVTGPMEVFGTANEYAAHRHPGQPPPYRLSVLAREAGSVALSSGLTLQADASYRTTRAPIDTLLVAGGAGVFAAREDRALIGFLQRQAAKARRVAGVCTGAFLLAEAGVLQGLCATTHWRYVDRLQREYPGLEIDADALFVQQGRCFTSAGVTAGIDLALALVAEDLGRPLALRVARELVVFMSRPGGQSQFSHYLAGQTHASEDFDGLVEWLGENLEADITVEDMAAHCGMSPRHFARLFREKMATTPAKLLEQLRLEKARVLLEQPDVALKTVIRQSGFHSHEHLRRCFRRHLHVNPLDYRRRF